MYNPFVINILVEREKILYEPPVKKRFEVSQDPYSRERVNVLKTIKTEVGQALLGVSIALTLSGSLSKGKILTAESAGYSDVDFSIFFDSDEVRLNHSRLMQLSPIYARKFDLELMYADSFPDYVKFLGRKVVEKTDDSFKGWPMSQEDKERYKLKRFSVRAGQTCLRDMTDKLLDGKPFLHDFGVRQISLDGGDSITSAVTELQKALKDFSYSESALDNLVFSVAKYFCLDVGGGMKKYRHAFLMQLGELGQEDAQKKWQAVNFAIEKYERRAVIPPGIQNQFPKTYQEACHYYGLKVKCN